MRGPDNGLGRFGKKNVSKYFKMSKAFVLTCLTYLTMLTLYSLAVVIVSLININNWPYLGINNFQLMNQIRTLA